MSGSVLNRCERGDQGILKVNYFCFLISCSIKSSAWLGPLAKVWHPQQVEPIMRCCAETQFLNISRPPLEACYDTQGQF